MLQGDFDDFFLTLKLQLLSNTVTSPTVSTPSSLPNGFCSNNGARTGQSAECKSNTTTTYGAELFASGSTLYDISESIEGEEGGELRGEERVQEGGRS